MIGTLLRIGFINIRRDRVVQALMFLLPIMFVSIFATVFGNQRNVSERITVAVERCIECIRSRREIGGMANAGDVGIADEVDGNAV